MAGPGSVRKCHRVTLADLGDTEGFDGDGEEDQLYAFQLTDEMYRRKKLPLEEDGLPKFEGLSNVDVTYATPKRVHTLVYTGERWLPFADPSQQTGWIADIKISSLYVVTGQQHKVRKVVNSGNRLCSYVPKTKKRRYF